MADRVLDRAPSVSSSTTDAESFDGQEKNFDGSFASLKTPEEIDGGDAIERAERLAGNDDEPAAQPKKASARQAGIWMVVNTLATIGIVRPRRTALARAIAVC